MTIGVDTAQYAILDGSIERNGCNLDPTPIASYNIGSGLRLSANLIIRNQIFLGYFMRWCKSYGTKTGKGGRDET